MKALIFLALILAVILAGYAFHGLQSGSPIRGPPPPGTRTKPALFPIILPEPISVNQRRVATVNERVNGEERKAWGQILGSPPDSTTWVSHPPP